MNPLIVIGLVSVVIVSLVLINGTIDNQQELSEINISVQQKNNEIAIETISIKGDHTNGILKLSNLSNEEIKVIQIRVYDSNGDFVESFEINEIIQGNTELEITNLPISLQEMLAQ